MEKSYEQHKRFARNLLPLLLAAAGGCSTIDEHVRVDDWPQLKVIEHRVSYSQMYARCKKYTGFMTIPLGCTEFDFGAGEAHIWMTPGLAEKTVLAHELLHAEGYDHPGSESMARIWHGWLARNASSRGPADGGAAAGVLP